MKHFYLFCILLLCSNSILSQVNQHINYAHETEQIIDPLAVTPTQGTGASVEVIGNRMFVSQLATDKILVYERANVNAPWAITNRISRPDALGESNFGSKIAAWNDFLIVGDEINGAYSFSSYGKVYIFHKDAGGTDNWGLVKFLMSPTPTNNGYFGVSVDIEDNKIIVGATNEKKAYLFEKDNGGANNWGLSKTFTTPTSTSLSFGESVVLADNTLFIGGGWYTSGYSVNKGEVRIYGKDTGGTNNWGFIKSIREGRNTFGTSIAVSGNTMVVGSPRYSSDAGYTHAGNIFIFDKNLGGANNWGLQQMREPTNVSQLYFFGQAVAIQDDKIVAGAVQNSSGTEQVYYFNKTTGGTNNWGQFGLLLGSDNEITETDRGAFKFAGNDIYIGSAYGQVGSVYSVGKVYKYSFDDCFNMFTQLYDTIYYDEAITFGNNVLQYEGVYEQVIPKADGCDSTLVMNLEVASKLNFANPFGFAGGDGVYDVTLGDINGDGKLDMVTANYLAGNISVFQNQTATGVINPASFKSSFPLPAGPKATKVKIFDVDGDGKNDIVSTFYGTTASINDSVFVYRNIGAVGGTMNAAYFAPKVAFEVGNRPIDMSVADLDGDGLKDIAVNNFGTKTISLLRNESTPGTIAFATKLDVTLGGTTNPNETIRTEDLNGDGKPELISTSNSNGRIYVAENASVVGGFYFLTDFQMFFSSGNPGSVSIADLDNDGCKDIAHTRYKSAHQEAIYQSRCNSTLNAANYTESIVLTYPNVGGDYTGYMSEAADFDLNGQPDIVYTDKPANSTGRLRFLANIENGNGTIEPLDFHKDYSKNYTAVYTGMEYFSTFNYRVNIAVGDIDNDGMDDICVINFGEDKVWIFKNGSLIAGNQMGGTITSTVTSGNAYCSNDLINVSASSGTAYTANNSFTVQLSDNTGNFSSPVTIATVAGTTLSSYACTIPASIPYGTGYRVRVVSTSPYIVGADNGFDITISPSSSQTETVVACGSYTWPVNGVQYVNSANVTEVLTNSIGCDSTIILNLTITQPSSSSITTSACGTYTLNGQTYTSSGTYIQVIPNAANCDSTITLNLTIKQPTSSTITASACGSYTLNGQTYNSSGIFTQVIPNAANCDSTITLSLIIKQPTNSTVTASTCGTYTLNGQTYIASGTYTQVLPNAANCDSTITLNLVIKQPTSSTVTASACGTYTLNGQTYTASGTYTQVLPNAANCDSTITLNLTIKQPTSSTVTASACGTYTLNGQTYTASGTYTQVLSNAANCDSTITLNLIIKQPTSSTVIASACGSYTLNGQTYTASGTYTQVLPNAANCDSTITLNLTIKQPTSSTVIASACGTYTLNGQTYTASGTYTQVISNAANCDSTITLNLIIKQPTSSTVTTSACGSYTLNGQIYTASGTYTQVLSNIANCDSTITLNLTVNQAATHTITETACSSFTWTNGNGQTYNSSTTVSHTIPNGAANGCDSIITLNLTIGDIIAPIANTTNLANVTAQCSVAALTAPTATDNCAGTITGTHNATLPITAQGTTVVTWTYNDGNGNIATQTQNVIVNDNTAPVADVTTLSNVTAPCSVTALTAPTATDNCAGTVTGTHNATLPITTPGTTVVTWTYNDGHGNTSTQTQHVIINDNTAPVANVDALLNVTGQCSVTSLTAPTATDNCAGVITGTHNATLPITAPGTTVVTWTYNDGHGNISTQTQNVIITVPVATTTVSGITISATTSGATYQWINCGNGNSPIAGATSQSYTATVNGTYAVIVTQNGCSATSACVTISTVGLEEKDQTVFAVYPNPNNGTFKIITGTGLAVRISNAAGQLVLTQELKAGENTIELINVENGVYFISSTDANGQVFVERVSVVK